jgi:hypothetical protein
MIEVGVMPLASLWAAWMARRRSVSLIALGHAVGQVVTVENGLTADVAGGATDGLN